MRFAGYLYIIVLICVFTLDMAC